jgi:hypothetical protein
MAENLDVLGLTSGQKKDQRPPQPPSHSFLRGYVVKGLLHEILPMSISSRHEKKRREAFS